MFHRPASSFATMAARYWRSSMVASGWVAAHTRAAMHMVSRNDGSWLLTAFMKSALSIGGFLTIVPPVPFIAVRKMEK